MDIPLILDYLFPYNPALDNGVEWVILGSDKGDYANLEWRDEKVTKPTEQEIIDAWPIVQAQLAAEAQAESDKQADIDVLLAQIDTKSTELETALTDWDTLTPTQKDDVLKSIAQIELRALRVWRHRLS